MFSIPAPTEDGRADASKKLPKSAPTPHPSIKKCWDIEFLLNWNWIWQKRVNVGLVKMLRLQILHPSQTRAWSGHPSLSYGTAIWYLKDPNPLVEWSTHYAFDLTLTKLSPGWTVYSGYMKSDQSKSGSLQNLDILEVGFWMVGSCHRCL